MAIAGHWQQLADLETATQDINRGVAPGDQWPGIFVGGGAGHLGFSAIRPGHLLRRAARFLPGCQSLFGALIVLTRLVADSEGHGA
ncbi:MAG: hypothetical protein IPL78_18795, partial [Chloroflexi bacterium]|nr:hypothetical protein [Chloroflexota bacterium]